jgi:hypothetical protein
MATVERRLEALEGALSAMAVQVVTRRLVVTDPQGRPRLVAEVNGSTVELRLVVTGASGTDASVVLHASNPDADFGPLTGVQIWASGDVVMELDAWPDADGRWRPHAHVGGPI